MTKKTIWLFSLVGIIIWSCPLNKCDAQTDFFSTTNPVTGNSYGVDWFNFNATSYPIGGAYPQFAGVDSGQSYNAIQSGQLPFGGVYNQIAYGYAFENYGGIQNFSVQQTGLLSDGLFSTGVPAYSYAANDWAYLSDSERRHPFLWDTNVLLTNIRQILCWIVGLQLVGLTVHGWRPPTN